MTVVFTCVTSSFLNVACGNIGVWWSVPFSTSVITLLMKEFKDNDVAVKKKSTTKRKQPLRFKMFD